MVKEKTNKLELSRFGDTTFDISYIYGPFRDDKALEGRVVHSPKIEDHFIISYQPLAHFHPGNVIPLGIAHTSKELPEKAYSCARDYAIRTAKSRGLEFVNLVAQSSPSCTEEDSGQDLMDDVQEKLREPRDYGQSFL